MENSNSNKEKDPIIPYASQDNIPDSLKQILKPYIERMGFLPNALKLYMHRPEIAEVMWTLNNRIMRDPSSTLDLDLKRKLATVASKLNGCNYCTTHHCAILQNTAIGNAEGWDMNDNDLQDLLNGNWVPENDMERTCFDYVTEASLDPTNITAQTYENMKQHLSPKQTVELATVVGFWKMYNTIHDGLKIPIETRLSEVSKKTGLQTTQVQNL